MALNELISLFNKSLLFPSVTGPLDFSDINSLALVASEVRRQATMIGYINAFKLFTVLSVLPIPFIWLARLPRHDS
jgi:hypothetical protein